MPELVLTEDQLTRGAVIVFSRAMQGDPVAMGVLLEEHTIVTIFDLPPDRDVYFATVRAMRGQRDLGTPEGGGVTGTVIAEDKASRLLVFRLERSLDSPATLAAEDPRLGANLHKSNNFSSSYWSGPVEGVDATTQVFVSPKVSVEVSGVMIVRMPANPGDGGSPLLNDEGEVAAVVVAGSEDLTIAVPVSTVRRIVHV